MSLADIQTLAANNLAFAIARGGKDVTLNAITGKAIVSAIERMIEVDDMGEMPRTSLNLSLPITTWPTAPTVSQIFTMDGETFRVLSVLKSFCGHSWGIEAVHISGS